MFSESDVTRAVSVSERRLIELTFYSSLALGRKAQQPKLNSTFTVDQGDYTPDIEPTPAVVNEYDAGKMKQGAPGRYLLETEHMEESSLDSHLAEDLLFSAAIRPDTPADVLCEDDELYDSFREYVPNFMSKFASSSKTYFSRCGGTPNTGNPFSFNLTSDTNFLRGYVQVYRKEEVMLLCTTFTNLGTS
ncbi:hypothetical protein R3P38DRAFT_2787432 [Favolaschia claudopus]|uniref:Uncharacterized protein n=1 Tax=Favolaschia claudopus TaxID=2862362 RepID=A0AAW0AMX7_9AGAR